MTVGERRRLLISGRVQGVYFRDSARQVAAAAGVYGWARNLADGRVEVVLEGDPADLDRLVEWCRHGPPLADVSAVEVTIAPIEGLSGFVIG